MIKITTGDTAGFTFSLVYPGDVADHPVPDISNTTVRFIIKKNVNEPDYKAVFMQEIVHPETNIVHFEMKPEDTAKLISGTYKAGCKLFYDNGLELTVWSDDILATKGVFDA